MSPAAFAALAAPGVSRAFVGAMRACGSRARDALGAYPRQGIGYLIDLRNPFADGRELTLDDVAAVARYSSPQTREQAMASSVEHGMLEVRRGAYRATERGSEFLRDLWAMQVSVLDERWGTAPWVHRLNDVLGQVLDTAAGSAGAAWSVQAPPHEPAGSSPAVVLLNRLSTLRYHRADAHAAAWQEAGLSASEIAAMPWGTQWSSIRTQVEADTNWRDAAAYDGLSAEDRLQFLGDLAALA